MVKTAQKCGFLAIGHNSLGEGGLAVINHSSKQKSGYSVRPEIRLAMLYTIPIDKIFVEQCLDKKILLWISCKFCCDEVP